MSRILVTGACGWIGYRVCQYLRSKGHEVVAMDLIKGTEGPWNQYLSGNIASDDVLRLADDAALNGISGLVHCAGYAHRPVETPEEVQRFWAINRDGSGRIISLAKAVGIERVVYVSSIAFYRWGGAEPATEDAELEAVTAYAQSKLAGEEIFRKSGLDWRSVRLATIFGEGDRANFSKLATAMARRRFILPGSGKAQKSVLPVDIAAQVLARMALESSPPHQLINTALSTAPTLKEICESFSEHCGFAFPPSVPLPVLTMAAACGSVVARVRPNFPLTLQNVRKLTTSTVVDTGRFEACFPDLAGKRFEDGILRSAEYYKTIAATF